MCCLYHTRHTINLVSATKNPAFWVMEYCVFVKDLVDCSATTHGVIFAKYVAQITKQQGRYAVGHGLSPLGNRPSLSRCMHRRKVAARRGGLVQLRCVRESQKCRPALFPPTCCFCFYLGVHELPMDCIA